MDPPATALRLKPIHIRGFPPLLEIPEEGLTIGRADENQVVLPGDAFPHVSALHARIEMRDGELMIEDLDSKNGTLVNGKPVEQRPLSKGDVVQLGSLGPRFLVVTAGDIDATVSIAPGAVPGALGTVEADQRSPGATTILRLKSALGIPAGEGGVRRLVERRSRRLMLIGAFLLIAFVTTWVGLYLRQERRRAGEVAGLLERRVEANDRVAAQGRALEVQRRALEGERDRLRERIRTLEEEKRVSVDEVDLLRRELTATEEKLELYSPIRLEKEAQERMAQVMGVRSAVVLIETRVRYRER
ncbi:MAG: FHA domain-containing protein, partial [Planctomycetota bacterium]